MLGHENINQNKTTIKDSDIEFHASTNQRTLKLGLCDIYLSYQTTRI